MQNARVISPHIPALTNVKMSGTLWPSIYADNPEQKRVLRALRMTRAGWSSRSSRMGCSPLKVPRHLVHVPGVVYIRKSRSLGSANVTIRFLFMMRKKP